MVGFGKGVALKGGRGKGDGVHTALSLEGKGLQSVFRFPEWDFRMNDGTWWVSRVGTSLFISPHDSMPRSLHLKCLGPFAPDGEAGSVSQESKPALRAPHPSRAWHHLLARPEASALRPQDLPHANPRRLLRRWIRRLLSLTAPP